MLLSVLGWSLVAAAASEAAPPRSGTPIAAAATVTLSPTHIKADGSSTSIATATLPGSSLLDNVVFSSTDPGQGVSAASFNIFTGTYSATITSSTTPGSSTITATDITTGVSAQATLVQYGPASAVSSVVLSPTSIIANGSSTTTATATVQDAQGNGVPGETVTFSPTPTGVVIDNGDGTYTATITSSTTAGPVTVTATDGLLSNHATLTQLPGAATNVSIVLSPTSIPANGSSTTTATATVMDASGNLVSTDNVVFVPSDPGDTIAPSPATNNHNGTYTATITSSTTPGSVQIVAVDVSTGANAQTTLTQTQGSSTTGISVLPAQPVTNQTVTMVATVDVNSGPSSGTVAFDDGGTPISGCDNVSVSPVGSGAGTASCQTSFAAANSPVSLTAVFRPSAGNVGGSTSNPTSLTVGQDSTMTDLTPSSTNPTTGTTVTYLAAVVPKHPGPTQPSGKVQFTDGSHPLSGCASQPLLLGNSSSSSGASAAVCRVSFGAVGHRVITAHYLGDASFTGSDSGSTQTVVRKRPPPQRLSAVLQWSFNYHPAYTLVALLQGNGVPAGATIQISCNGQGCPYAKRVIAVANFKSCKSTATRRCTTQPTTTVGLSAAFRHHRLKPGTRLTVEILRPGRIGKYYRFTTRAGQGPGQQVSCLAPGSARPGVGC